MAKMKTQYVCSECGYMSAKWAGQCQGCGNWNTPVSYTHLDVYKRQTQGYSPMDSAREMLRNTVWLGQGNEVADSFTENDVTRLIYRVGWLPFFAMLAAMAGFYAYLLKQCIRPVSYTHL